MSPLLWPYGLLTAAASAEAVMADEQYPREVSNEPAPPLGNGPASTLQRRCRAHVMNRRRSTITIYTANAMQLSLYLRASPGKRRAFGLPRAIERRNVCGPAAPAPDDRHRLAREPIVAADVKEFGGAGTKRT